MNTPEFVGSPAGFVWLFRTIWRNHVRQRYDGGVINSERALQACIVEALAPCAPEIVTLVEPTLEDRADGPAIIPDLWVGDPQSGKTIAVIELKFVPHRFPVWEKDLRNLAVLLTGSYCEYDIDPKAGANRSKMRCDDETIGIYAVVGRHDSLAVSRTLASRAHEQVPAKETLSRMVHATGIVHDDPTKGSLFDAFWIGESAENHDRILGPSGGAVPMRLPRVTDEFLLEAIASLKDEFDSHEVIEHVMRHHPQEYTRDLYSYVEASDPIQQYHATIGKRIGTLGFLDKTDRPITGNARRRANDNQGWRKKSQG